MDFGRACCVFACTGGGNVVNPTSLNQAVSVSYGTVESVTPVKLSPTGEIAGGMMGGARGFAMSRSSRHLSDRSRRLQA